MQVIQTSRYIDRLDKQLQRFSKYCELILITAARDLAILTQHDIQANFIVSLSQQAESLHNIYQSNKGEQEKLREIRNVCRELLLGIGNICHRAHQLKDKPLRHSIYDRFRLQFDYWWQSLAYL